MKYLSLLLLFITSCGTFEGPKGHKGDTGNSCTVEEYEDGGVIVCADGTEYIIKDGEQGLEGSQGEQGPPGEDGQDYHPDPGFEGYWDLPNGGYLELFVTKDNRAYIYGTQRIYSVNFDDGLALHPNISAGPHFIRDSIVNGEYYTTYSSTTHDLERDGTTSNITGSRKTVYTLKIQSDGKLRINLITYSSDGLTIDANRIIISNNG